MFCKITKKVGKKKYLQMGKKLVNKNQDLKSSLFFTRT